MVAVALSATARLALISSNYSKCFDQETLAELRGKSLYIRMVVTSQHVQV